MIGKEIFLYIGLFLAMLFLVGCGSMAPTPVSEAPAAADEETVSKVSVTLKSGVHSSDLGGYAWLQEFLSSNDLDAADTKSLSESARAGAVCYVSIAPSVKSAPSASDGTFSVTFEAEPGSTFRIMCDPDETHPGGLGIDLFTVPAAGGTIDHATAGFLYPVLWTPELGVTNELAAEATGYADAEEMFQSAGTCRVLALPGEGATIDVSDADAFGFYMEAPDDAGRLTALQDPSPFGAYIVVKEFEAGETEADINIDFTDTSGSGLTWPTATCPIQKGFSTHLEVLPEPVVDAAAPAVSVSDVFFIPDEPVITSGPVASSSESADQGPQVPGASSTLERSEDQLTMSLQTSDLEPGIYTVWWVICPPNQSSDEMALAVGEQIGQDGLGNFEATLERENLDKVQDLLNSKVELIVRYHGPPIEGRIEEQKTDMEGGCDIDPDPCENVQIAVHPGSE